MVLDEHLPPSVLSLAQRERDGLMTNRQICRLGYTSWDLTRWVRSGLLLRPVRGLYQIPGDTREHGALHVAHRYLNRRQRNSASFATGVAEHLLAGQAVLAVHGLTSADDREVIGLLQEGRRVRVADAPFVVRHVDLSLEDPIIFRGMRLAEPALAVGHHVDQQMQDVEVRRAVDELRWAGMDIFPAVRLWAARSGGGFSRLTRLADAGAFEQESEGERTLFHEVLLRCGPPPDCQVWVAPQCRVDFVYLDAALIIEYHGRDAHAGRVDEDAMRIYRLQQMGYDVIVVTQSMLADPGLVWFIRQRRAQGIADLASGRRRRPPRPVDRPRLRPLRTAA